MKGLDSFWGLSIRLALFLVVPTSGAADVMHFLYDGPESNRDNRRAYTWNVLREALEVTKGTYGPYEMQPTGSMTEARQIREMKDGGQLLNTMVLPSRRSLLNVLIPVRIPIDRGMLGFRVLLIRGQEQGRFDAIKSLEDLKKFTIGQGADWVDRTILSDAGLEVVPGTSYEGLFDMLMAKRFDAFSRSVSEADLEWEARKGLFPGMAIERGLLLYYPMPAYLWFPNTEDGKLRAKRVEAGLRILIANGTLERMFQERYGALIEKMNLAQRRLIRLENSQIGPEEPLKDANLWFNPLEPPVPTTTPRR